MTVFDGLRNLAAALWLGLVVTLGGVAAPTLFAMLERSQAGAIAGQLFRIEAQAGLVLGVVLLVLERRFAARQAGNGVASRMSTGLLLILGAVFCTVLGFYALQPLMAAARAGQGSWSFGQLHAVSSALFGLKGLCLLALVWRAQ